MDQELYNGWRILFRQNVHMYCHQLTASKGDLELEIPCEDMPAGPIGIWPYTLELDAPVYDDLLMALRAWATSIGVNYRLYVTKDRFEPN